MSLDTMPETPIVLTLVRSGYDVKLYFSSNYDDFRWTIKQTRPQEEKYVPLSQKELPR